MRLSIYNSDPLPLEKARHLFKEGDRVSVIDGPHSGRSGKLLVINAHKGHVVRLDSGHEVEYSDRELEPEGFSRHGRKIAFSAPRDFDANEIAIAKASGDPLPIADSPARSETRILPVYERELAKFDPLPLDSFSEVSEVVDNTDLVGDFVKAVETGRVSFADLTEVQRESDLIRERGGRHSHSALIAVLKKYSGGGEGDVLQKRMRPGLKVGMKVRGRIAGESGKIGTIESIKGPMVKVRFDDGSGESTTLLTATMETLIPVEA